MFYGIHSAVFNSNRGFVVYEKQRQIDVIYRHYRNCPDNQNDEQRILC